MNKTDFLITGLALSALALTGCETSKVSVPRLGYHPVTMTGTRDWNTQIAPEGESLEDVTAFAVSLGAEGRHDEAAAILEEKAGNVVSRRNELNIQLYLAAANEYLQAGDTLGFTRSLARAEEMADRYQRAAWNEQTRSLFSLRERLMENN